MPHASAQCGLLRILNVRYLVLPEEKTWNGASPVLRVNGELVYDLGALWASSGAWAARS